MGRKETPYADGSRRPVVPDLIAESDTVSRLIGKQDKRPATDTHVARHFSTDSIYQCLESYGTRTWRFSTAASTIKVCILADHRQHEVLKQPAFQRLGGGPHCLFLRLSSVTPPDSTWVCLRAH